FNVPVSGRKSLMRSRRSFQRARLRKKKSDAVTQERSTCPSPEEKARCGHAGEFNVPVSGRKRPMRSRRRVQRARVRGKRGEGVTEGGSTCPPPEEKVRCGHAGAFNVPVSGGKSPMRSRRRVQRARLRKKKSDAVTQESSTCPAPGENWRGGHVGVFNVPVSGGKSPMRSRR